MTITIGALSNVPNPGAPINSPWAQDVSRMGRHVFASKAALDVATWPGLADGMQAFTSDDDTPWTRRAGVWLPDYHEARYASVGNGATVTTAETWLGSIVLPARAYPYRVRFFASFVLAGPAPPAHGDLRARYNTTGAAIAVTDTVLRGTRFGGAAQNGGTLIAEIDRPSGPLTIGVLALTSAGTAPTSGDGTQCGLWAHVSPVYA